MCFQGYKIFYTTDPSYPLALWDSVVAAAESRAANITGLVSNTTYSFAILAFNTYGSGPLSQLIQVFTRSWSHKGGTSRSKTKSSKWHVSPSKTHISLGIHTIWSESWLCAQWVAEDPRFLRAESEDSATLSFHWAHSEDSDKTVCMPRLIWVFAGRTGHSESFVMLRFKFLGNHISPFVFRRREASIEFIYLFIIIFFIIIIFIYL